MDRTPPESRIRDALARLAAEDLDQVIDEARAEARERVRPILAEALADAMLEQVRLSRATTEHAPPKPPPAEAVKPPPAPPKPPPAEPVKMPQTEAERDVADGSPAEDADATGLYVFCVLASQATLPADLVGLEPNTRPRLIRHGNLAAVVSDVPLHEFDSDQLRENLNDMQWLERTARAHESVLEAIGEQETLVPMRLCSIYRADEGIIEMLAREGPTLEETLQRLSGKTEWGVKVFADSESAIPTASMPARNGSGADYLRKRQSEREERQTAGQRQHDAVVAIHDQLAAVAAEALSAPPQRAGASGRSGDMVLNGVYLVEDERRQEFLELVKTLHDEHQGSGLELEPTGPWPAYNFVPSEIGAAA